MHAKEKLVPNQMILYSMSKKEEADKVAANITEILSEKTFNFSPSYLKEVHKRLFKDVLRKVPAGNFRNYNITKQEWVLAGDTVFYSDFNLIQETLDYDFNAEHNFDYSTLSKDEFVKHITRFVANLWQVHAFGEGNTRTTAVFIIKYLEKFFRNLILGEQNELRNRYCHVLYSEISGNTATANATVNIKKNMKKLQDEGVCENQQK